MHVLIIKLSSIGDIVHTLPVLAAIRKGFPDAAISWAVEANSAEILRNNPMLDRLIEVDTRSLRRASLPGKTIKTAVRQFRDLRASDFDVSIDLQGLLKSAFVSKLSGAKFRTGFSKTGLREPSAGRFYTKQFEAPSDSNVIFKNLSLAEQSLAAYLKKPDFTFDDSEINFPIEIGAEHIDESRSIQEKTGPDFVILNPAGGWVTKLWPAENYGLLADQLWVKYQINSLICTGPGESDLAERALDASKSGRVQTATPSLKGFYELARHAKAYVGGDTAPTHLAVAAGCPVIGIFGPTEWWRNGSPRPEDLVIERNDIDCRENCHRRTCGKWICMDIPVETVLLGIKTRLGL